LSVEDSDFAVEDGNLSVEDAKCSVEDGDFPVEDGKFLLLKMALFLLMASFLLKMVTFHLLDGEFAGRERQPPPTFFVEDFYLVKNPSSNELPTWELTYPLSACTFQSVMFLFPFGGIC